MISTDLAQLIADQTELDCTILVVGSAEWLNVIYDILRQELDIRNMPYKYGRNQIRTNGSTVYFSTSRRLQWLRGMKAHYVHIEPEASTELRHSAELFLGSYTRK